MKITAFILGLIICLLQPSASSEGLEDAGVVTTYKIGSYKASVTILEIATPTDVDGQFNKKSAFYIFKLKHKGNYFSVNLPAASFNELTEQQKERMIGYLVGLYDEAFRKASSVFGRVPEGYRFNSTFGKTKMGLALNRINVTDRISNAFPDCLPYENGQDVLTVRQRGVMLHEIGHGLFGIYVGSFENPKTKAIEEGFVDYIAGRGFGEGSQRYVFEISRSQEESMRGLAQMDIDKSVWGARTALSPTRDRRYAGITHHALGIEFIETFMGVFGVENLSEFLMRLKASEGTPSVGDYGTTQIKGIFSKMGFTPEDIKKFEMEFHLRLKKNVFKVIELENV